MGSKRRLGICWSIFLFGVFKLSAFLVTLASFTLFFACISLQLLLLSLSLFLLVFPLFCREAIIYMLWYRRRLLDFISGCSCWSYGLRGDNWLLQSASYLHVYLLDDVLVLVHLCCCQLTRLCDFENLVVTQTDDDILRLEISVNDLAHAVHIVKTNQALASELTHKRKRDSLVVVALYDFKEVHTQNFKYHHEVFSIGSVMDKGIQ